MTSAESVAPGGSLRVRMLVSATLVLTVFLGMMGLVLDNAYRQSALQSVSERLQIHIHGLISVTMEDRGGDGFSLYLPEELQEPHFNSMGGGVYGVLFDAEGAEIWRSLSAIDLTLGKDESAFLLEPRQPGTPTFGQLPSVGYHGALFYMIYPVMWQSETGGSRFVYVVLQDLEPYRNEVASFRNALWGWLIAGVLVLAGVQAAIMYWGLLPLTGLERDLKAIEGGRQPYLEGRYPEEISGVTRSLNLLLATERKQREHYRTTLSDLAHSLKTPLAILKAEAQKFSSSAEMDEQVDRMNEIISWQLERAVSRSSYLSRQSAAIGPVAEKLQEALARVYAGKKIDITEAVGEATFPGDERDLMEVLGNLLDNACKYGRGKVRLIAERDGNHLRIHVEDNGSGISVGDRKRVLERGTRLDTREGGQGIGLAVVSEIVHRYHGEIDIDVSDLGGAKISLSFPEPL